ncbi:MAG: MarC family protein [Bacteroidota bacterium]|nr:MAG: MarC family protein [Bacteroidota bacterium]
MEVKLVNIVSTFMVLFAVIDITGSIPIIINIKQKSIGTFAPFKISAVAYIIMLLFLFLGEHLLQLFGVDLSSFAIAGSLVIFFLGLELVLGHEFFKYEPSKMVGIVPLSFPLIAGAGSMTTLISLRAEYSLLEIMISLTLNIVFVYFVLKSTRFFEKYLGGAGIQILKKFFGIILLAVSIKLFLSNTGIVLPHHG